MKIEAVKKREKKNGGTMRSTLIPTAVLFLRRRFIFETVAAASPAAAITAD